MLKRLHFEDRESWLLGRNAQGLGGSDAAAAVGLSPWETPIGLWRKKRGLEQPKDISGEAVVQQGIKMEPILRDFYASLHPEYQIEHAPYDIFYQSERPWLFATLDGILTDESGNNGILEIKTGNPTGAKWKEWADGNMPMNYYCQTLHYLLATGFSYVRLFACLFSMSGDMTIKSYEIERADVEADLAWLLKEETEFWGYVQRGEIPPQRLM